MAKRRRPNHVVASEFAQEFAVLVRKYMPNYPVEDSKDMDLLYRMGDHTSCFSPYVWSKEFDVNQGEST